ncbi:gas vesicle protein GvpG [Nocardia sp. NBC_01329]|uniref:gas vesicle protein GvpG n=1 Tax=Nocardia sp. NBC_01329 TaxID=2903594 RepID=UPI002E132881|nr:gas vesicle protein GvpG [Nocardia sp. NBC_01329]
MGLLSSIVTLPLAPVRGVVWLGEVIQDQVEQQLHSPAAVRREIEEIEAEAAAGRLSDAERDRALREALSRLSRPPGGIPPADEEE